MRETSESLVTRPEEMSIVEGRKAKKKDEKEKGSYLSSFFEAPDVALIRAAVSKGGMKALQGIPPVAFAAALLADFDPDDEQTYIAESVEIGPVVNPLLNAVLVSIGAVRRGERTYSVGIGKDADPRTLEALVEALPPTICYPDDTTIKEKIEKSGPYAVRRHDAASGLANGTFLATTIRARWSQARLYSHFNGTHPQKAPLSTACVVLTNANSQVYAKICTTSPNPRLGLELYPGAPNLDLYPLGQRKEPLRVTPDVAVALLEAAAEEGYVVLDPSGSIAELREKLSSMVVAQRVPAAPGEAQLVVGRHIKGVKGVKIPKPEARRTTRSVQITVSEVGRVMQAAEMLGATVATHAHVADAARMELASSPEIEGLRHYQNEAVALHLATEIGYVNASAPGLGKGHPVDTKVLTSTGWRRVGDLNVGDEVIGSDGRATRVVGVYPKGELDVYRVVFSDDSSVLCDEEHLWGVRHKSSFRPGRNATLRVKSVAELKSDLVSPSGDRKWRIPLVRPVELDDRGERPIEPYLLGVLLGDGCFMRNNVSFTNLDDEMAEMVREGLPEGHSIKLQQDEGKCPEYKIISKPDFVPNLILNGLRDLGLWRKRSEEKFVPKSYLFAPVEDRIALLQGLMDTDGWVNEKDNHVDFGAVVSRELAEAVKFLVQSIGGTARINEKREPIYTYKGERRVGQPAYRVSIQLPNGIQPFRLSRKANIYRPRSKYQPVRVMKSIVPAGRAEVVCIAVDAEDHLYVTEDFLVTHNTVMALASFQHKASWMIGWRGVVACPAAILTQWTREAKRFFPEAVVATPTPKEIQAGRLVELDEEVGAKPLLAIVSYDTVRRFHDKLAELGPNDLVVDEAAILKNPGSERTKALWQLRRSAGVAVALTGTPIERSLDDMGRIMAWARDDETLFHGARLSRRFDVTEDDGVKALWRAIGPCVFRRDRSEIADELPVIQTETVVLDPTPAEMALADGARRELKRIYQELQAKMDATAAIDPQNPILQTAKEELQKARGAALGGITLARMAASDPAAVAASDSAGALLLDSAGLVKPAVKTGGTKRTQIVNLTTELTANREAVLIFTDFSEVADHLVQDLQAAGVQAAVFKGGQGKNARDAALVGYQGLPCNAHSLAGEVVEACPDCRKPTLDCLVMTQAGREGLNLQRTTVLIHYDLPWMPSQVVQRVGRAARFGAGNKRLSVLVPIMAGTIEERVAAVLVPRAVVALAALDTHRGVKGSQTEVGLAISGIEDAVSDAEKEGQESVFEIAKAILGD